MKDDWVVVLANIVCIATGVGLLWHSLGWQVALGVWSLFAAYKAD